MSSGNSDIYFYHHYHINNHNNHDIDIDHDNYAARLNWLCQDLGSEVHLERGHLSSHRVRIIS